MRGRDDAQTMWARLRSGAVVVVVLALVSVALTAVLWLRHTAAEPAVEEPAVEEPAGSSVPRPAGTAEGRALAVLHDWDRRRAAAWAAGDPAMLAALYADSSRAGRRDLAMLRAYRRRGLRVEGMTTQVVSVRVQASTEHRWVLVVVDRLAAATAVAPGFRRRLPAGPARARHVVLERVGSRWRVVEVRPVS